MITPEKLNKAFQMWVEITGQGMETNNFSNKTHSIDVIDANRDIERSIDADPSLTLPFLLLDYHLDEFMDNREVSLKTLVLHEDRVQERILRCKELVNSLENDKDIIDIRSGLSTLFSSIQKEYNLSKEFLDILNTDKGTKTLLYKDAIFAMAHLRTMCFSAPPQPSNTPGATPRFVRSVHEFKSPSEFVAFMQNSIDCIVLGYLPHEDGISLSSFAFGIRRGTEVFLLTDLPDWDHPLQEGMIRKPSRILDSKESADCFPYDAINNVEEGKLPEENGEIKSIVVRGHSDKIPTTLLYLDQIPASQAYWIVLMSTFIKKKFYDDNFQMEERSVSGTCNTPLLPSQDIVNPVETLHDAVAKGLCGNTPKKQFAWMFERYKDKVNENLLFLTQYSDKGLLAEYIADRDAIKLLPSISEHADGSSRSCNLVVFNSGRVGTPKEIEADRAFLARYNEAKMIQKAAWDEFDKTVDEVYAWYVERVKKNMKNLYKGVANLSMDVKGGTLLYRSKGGSFEKHPKDGSILRVKDTTADRIGAPNAGAGCVQFRWGYVSNQRHGPVLLYIHVDNTPSWDKRCYLTGTKNPQIQATFTVESAAAIAAMAGCSVEDLPPVLQHRRKYEEYTGNERLNRIDPAEWAIQDPWMDGIDFDVTIFLSRKAFNNLRKEHGLKPDRFWLEDEETNKKRWYKEETTQE